MIQEKIIEQLQIVLSELGAVSIKPQVEIPSDLSHGDYTTNIAFHLSKIIKKPTLELAKEIAISLLKKPINGVEKIEAVKPGFINFWITSERLIKDVEDLSILSQLPI